MTMNLNTSPKTADRECALTPWVIVFSTVIWLEDGQYSGLGQLRSLAGEPIAISALQLQGHERFLADLCQDLVPERMMGMIELEQSMNFDNAAAFAMNAPALMAKVPEQMQSSPPPPGKGAGLTRREIEVLQLVAQGMSDREVADKLFLSPRTINAHLTSVYSKLGINSRVAATRYALECGLVD